MAGSIACKEWVGIATLLLLALAHAQPDAGSAAAPAPTAPVVNATGCADGTACGTAALVAQPPLPEFHASNATSSSGTAFHLSAAAVITVTGMGVALLCLVVGLGAWMYRKRRRLERRVRDNLERQALERTQQQAKMARAATALRAVYIPPIVVNPDSTMHLASAYGDQHGSTAEDWSFHGRTLLVHGLHTAFTCVTLLRTSMTAALPAAPAPKGGLTAKGEQQCPGPGKGAVDPGLHLEATSWDLEAGPHPMGCAAGQAAEPADCSDEPVALEAEFFAAEEAGATAQAEAGSAGLASGPRAGDPQP